LEVVMWKLCEFMGAEMAKPPKHQGDTENP